MKTKEVENVKQKEESFAHIGRNSFLLIVILLLSLIAVTSILTYCIPQGYYQRDEQGMIINGTYEQGSINGIAIWRVVTAPFRVFVESDSITIIMISVFLLIMSGVFNLLEKTQGLKIIIGRTVRKFSNKKRLVICVVTFVFMAFGSFFGLFEELASLLPLVIVFMLSMGLDTMTGLGVCMMAACFGFSAAITNPFSVGIVSEIAGVSVLDGAWLRILFFPKNIVVPYI